MTQAARALQAERLCWGLTLREAGALAGRLLGPADLDTLEEPPLRRAWARLSPQHPRPALGRAILARLEGADAAALATARSGWLAQRFADERPALRAALEAPSAGASSALRAWLEAEVARGAVALDPRHVTEAARGEVLEVEQLWVAHEDDQRLVLEALGVEVLRRATEELPPRARALLGQGLAPSARRLWDLAERDGALSHELPREVAKLCAPSAPQGHQAEAWAWSLGARAWACLDSARCPERALGLWSRTSPALGEAVRAACEGGPSLPAELRERCAQAALSAWQRASRAGLTRASVHQRRPLAAPPEEPLG